MNVRPWLCTLELDAMRTLRISGFRSLIQSSMTNRVKFGRERLDIDRLDEVMVESCSQRLPSVFFLAIAGNSDQHRFGGLGTGA